MGQGASSSSGDSIQLSQHRSARVIRQLAQGGFSTVMLVQKLPSDSNDNNNDNNVNLLACKQVTVGSSKEAEREALSEIAAHNLLGGSKPVSRYIIALLESSVALANGGGTNGKIITLVFPFYRKGSLAGLLSNLSNGSQRPISESSALHKFRCAAEALNACHELGLAHCDVKTHNLMLDDQDGVVLIDFGSSIGPPYVKTISTTYERTEVKERAEKYSSAAYRALELWDPGWNCSNSSMTTIDYSKVDVYALGCVLYACLFPPIGFTMFESPTQGLLRFVFFFHIIACRVRTNNFFARTNIFFQVSRLEQGLSSFLKTFPRLRALKN